MFIFVGKETKLVIHEKRIYKIQLVGKKIKIDYDGGELNFLEGAGNAVAPKIESFTMTYESEEIAQDILRSFYVACDKKAGAFYF